MDRILFATQNQTLSHFNGKEQRKPTCLIIDGIDPSSASSQSMLKILENYIKSGTLKTSKTQVEEISGKPDAYKIEKSKTVEKKKSKEVKRPIICICKNIYDRRLTPLKNLGLTFKIRKPDSKKLLNRLTEILENESVYIEPLLLKTLIIDTNHDITSCLNTLKYVISNLSLEECGKEIGAVKLAKVIKKHHLYDNDGNFLFKKDMLSSIFDSWEKIMKVKSKFDPKLSFTKIKQIVFECDRIQKFNEGIYHNYVNFNYYDEFMEKSVKIVNALCDEDIRQGYIGRTMNYSLQSATYLPAATFHIYLSTTGKVQNEYPKLFTEMYTKRHETTEAIAVIREGKKEKFERSSLEANIKADTLKCDNFQTIKLLSKSQLMTDIIPYVMRLYRPANYVKQSILTEQQYKQLSNILDLLKIFPIELVKKLSYNESQTRGAKMGLNTLGTKGKNHYSNYIDIVDVMETQELAYKIKLKLMDNEKVFGNKLKPTAVKPVNCSKKPSPGLIDPFGRLGSKRPRNEMETDEENFKFIFKHREGYINAVKRNVPFEFFM